MCLWLPCSLITLEVPAECGVILVSERGAEVVTHHLTIREAREWIAEQACLAAKVGAGFHYSDSSVFGFRLCTPFRKFIFKGLWCCGTKPLIPTSVIGTHGRH